MAQLLTLSRRRAALAIAGTFAASAGSAAVGAPKAHAGDRAAIAERQALIDRQREVLALLQRVRRAHGSRARAVAFDVCAIGLRWYGELHASLRTSVQRDRLARRTAALYGGANDPSLVLISVIVRELASWPAADAGWLDRFGDLETAFAAHVAEHRQLAVLDDA